MLTEADLNKLVRRHARRAGRVLTSAKVSEAAVKKVMQLPDGFYDRFLTRSAAYAGLNKHWADEVRSDSFTYVFGV